MRLTLAQQDQVRANLGLARTIAARAARSRRCMSCEDLYGAACLGLCLAAADFNPAQGVPFSAYATLRIKGEVGEAVRRHFPLGFRKEALRLSAPRIAPLGRTHSALDPAPPPEHDQEWADLMDWWFKQLTPDQAQVMRGIYWAGLPIRSSKQWAGIPYWYARELRTQALNLLRSQLAA